MAALPELTISSRTPQGMPSTCPLCGAETMIDYSDPAGDATCPRCGNLLWASLQLIPSVTERIEDMLGVTPGKITADTRLSEVEADSLDTIETVMELEEGFDIDIPDSEAENILTIVDAARYIQDHRRDRDGQDKGG